MKIFLLLLILPLASISQTWTMQNSAFWYPAAYPIDISIVDPQTVWLVGENGSGTPDLIREFSCTTDGGQNWVSGNVGPDSSLSLASIAALSDSVAFVLGYNGITHAGGSMWKTVDAGTNWMQIPQVFDSLSFPNFICFFDDARGIAVGDPDSVSFEIYITSDSGNTWNRIPSNDLPPILPGEYGVINDYDVVGDIMWFGTGAGRIFRTIDAGQTWQAIDIAHSTQQVISAIAFSDAANGLCVSTPAIGTGDVLLTTTDSGLTWIEVMNPAGPVFYPEICDIPGTGIYVSCSANLAYGRGSSYSPDNGQTWILIDTAGAGTVNGYTELEFYDLATGWAGGFTLDELTDGIYKWNPGTLRIPSVTYIDVSIYPNPSTDYVWIDGGDVAFTVTVFNMSGQVVLNDGVALRSRRLQLDGLKAGTYFLRLMNAVGETSLRKLVVM